jgi:hypothetical protein
MVCPLEEQAGLDVEVGISNYESIEKSKEIGVLQMEAASVLREDVLTIVFWI